MIPHNMVGIAYVDNLHKADLEFELHAWGLSATGSVQNLCKALCQAVVESKQISSDFISKNLTFQLEQARLCTFA